MTSEDDIRDEYYAGQPCERHRIPAPDCRDCAALYSARLMIEEAAR